MYFYYLIVHIYLPYFQFFSCEMYNNFTVHTVPNAHFVVKLLLIEFLYIIFKLYFYFKLYFM